METLTQILCPDVPLHAGCNQPKVAGDHVMLGSNHGPVFEVVHVAGDMAWVRPLSNGEEGLVSLDRLKVVSGD